MQRPPRCRSRAGLGHNHRGRTRYHRGRSHNRGRGRHNRPQKQLRPITPRPIINRHKSRRRTRPTTLRLASSNRHRGRHLTPHKRRRQPPCCATRQHHHTRRQPPNGTRRRSQQHRPQLPATRLLPVRNPTERDITANTLAATLPTVTPLRELADQLGKHVLFAHPATPFPRRPNTRPPTKGGLCEGCRASVADGQLTERSKRLIGSRSG